MKEQQILNFNSKPTYLEENFIEDISNIEVLNFFNKFPNWENKLVNIFGEEKSGKTYLLKILKKKYNFIYIDRLEDFEIKFDQLFTQEKLILDEIIIEEKKLFSLLNNFLLHKKYLVISSKKPITLKQTNLNDLNSRLKEFFLLEILNPSDQLVYSLILKFFSDNQVFLKKEIIENIVKKIDRSYSRINQFLSKLNDLSISKKKKIDFKLINEVINLIN